MYNGEEGYPNGSGTRRVKRASRTIKKITENFAFNCHNIKHTHSHIHKYIHMDIYIHLKPISVDSDRRKLFAAFSVVSVVSFR